jgi:class 3 adenylate cyclase
VNCSSCGFANAGAARFCAGCGKPLDNQAPVADPGERRQLTVLLCDLVGSTALAHSLDPEDLRALITDYQHVCSEVVERHDGHIAHYLGDGVVIYFGFPLAHEDDARRAVRCGLDILNEMQELNRRTARGSGAKLQARGGVHTGRVVVAPVGGQQTAHGEAPNIAARLQSVGDPDWLVVSDVTWGLVHGYFHGESLGETELKGFAEPMRLWRVTGTSGVESRLEIGGALTDYVGRRVEGEALAAEWALVASGEGRFVTVQGEAGIGKSRLVQEFVERVAGPGVDRLGLRFTSYSQNSAFLPLTELIEGRLGLDRSLPAEARLDRIEQRLAELGIADTDAAPLLAELLSIPTDARYPPLEISPVRRRSRTQEILLTSFKALAAQRPTILVAEDLHWADPSTLELLGLLVSSAPQLPLLGLFTARPEFAPPWAGASAATLIELSRLDDTEVEAVVRAVAHGKIMPRQVMREIMERCDGVPLFVEEVTRSLIESGALEEHEFSWGRSEPLPAGLVPASIDASLAARLDHLGNARSTAELAATIGREFSYALLRAVSDKEDDALGEDLQRIVDMGLAWNSQSVNAETFVFKHALIQETAYESLLRSNRQRFHQRIANELQERFPEIVENQPELIAHHLTGAGNDEEAVGFWEAAGRRAVERTAMEEAYAHLRHAIESVSRLPEDPRWLERELDLQNLIAPVLMAVRGWSATHVREACERARELATRLERRDKIYPAVWGLWSYYFIRGEMNEALAAGESAREVAEASRIPMLRITGHEAISLPHLYRGEFEEALSEAKRGLAFFELEQERVLTGMLQLAPSILLRAGLCGALWMLGENDRAYEERERILQFGREFGHVPTLAACLGFHLFRDFNYNVSALGVDEQITDADELLVLTRDEGLSLWHAYAVVIRGVAAAVQGDEAMASTLIRDGLAEIAQTGAGNTLQQINVMCAQARMLLGQDDEAWGHLDDAQTDVHTRSVRLFEAEVHRVRASLQLRRGDPAAAQTSLRQAFAIARRQKACALELRAALDLYDLLADSEHCGEGRALVEGVLQQFDLQSSQPEVVRARTLSLRLAAG